MSNIYYYLLTVCAAHADTGIYTQERYAIALNMDLVDLDPEELTQFYLEDNVQSFWLERIPVTADSASRHVIAVEQIDCIVDIEPA